MEFTTYMIKNVNTKIISFIPKYVKKQQVKSVRFSFFAIFCRFNKQKMLVNNKNKLNTIIQIFI